MTYRVRLYCRDCSGGKDPMGCFDGGTELLHEAKSPWGLREFATVAEAESAGWDAVTDCGPWEFFVIDSDDRELYDSVFL